MSEDAKKASSALPKPGRIKQAGVLPSASLRLKVLVMMVTKPKLAIPQL